MIVRFAKPGKSFKGLATYLSHDADKAVTAERVAWTHTLNLANDHVPSAVDEMLWSCRAANQLKRQAGIGAGGRRLEHPVKHFSLNWAPSDDPTQAQMIEAVEDFVRQLGWDDRQAVLWAHSDKEYKHVHVMLNAVSPIDGRSIDTSFERVRASNWALAYERDQFRIHCEQRLKPYEQREAAPTRAAWQTLKEAEREENPKAEYPWTPTPEYFERGERKTWQARERELLQEIQKEERIAFFLEGKQAFRERREKVFREVREEFRPEWRALYKAKRLGLDSGQFAEMKAALVDAQNITLMERRDEACGSLREHRDEEYEYLLFKQQEQRDALKTRQRQGVRSTNLLDRMYDPDYILLRDRDQDREDKAEARPLQVGAAHAHAAFESPANETFKMRDGFSAMGGLGLGALGAIAEIGERLFDSFFGGVPAPKIEKPTPPPAELQQPEAKLARATDAQVRAAESQATEAEQLEDYWQERRQRRRERD